MKRRILVAMAIAFTILACDEKKPYTENSPEIDIYKKVVLAYENREWQDVVSHYHKNAKILNSSLDAKNILHLVEMNSEDAKAFKNWRYVNKEFLMLTKNSGEKWVYFKGLWKGTSASGNRIYEIPAQINVQFSNGKIVREEGYWDISDLLLDMQASSDVKKNKETKDQSI